MSGSKDNQNARKYTDKQIEDIKSQLEKYINDNEIPIVAEFAYQNNIPRTTLYEIVPSLLKSLIDKKESQLEKLALNAKVNATMAIFSLKQMGWRDRHEVENVNTNMNIDVKSDKELKDLQKDMDFIKTYITKKHDS
jgi:hypothetical protein